jgi:hypothetical protein
MIDISRGFPQMCVVPRLGYNHFLQHYLFILIYLSIIYMQRR